MLNAQMQIAALLIGITVGLAVGWLYARQRAAAIIARLETELQGEREKSDWHTESDQRLRETFEALASKALKSNSETFVRQTRDQLDATLKQMKGDWSLHKEQITNLVQPVERSLKSLDEQVRQIEQKREGAYKTLEQHIGDLKSAHRELRDETGHLRQALTTSARARGQWGEVQLRRIVEMSGMLKHVDFQEQAVTGDQRPDMVIRLPNSGILPVDAKTSMEYFLQAVDAKDEAERKKFTKQHGAAMRGHIGALGKKEYWKQFDVSPEVVVMFVPNEACLSASFEEYPDLIEEGLRQHVLVATPVTLYGLLKAIAYGWQQQSIAENAKVIAAEGQQLCDRLGVFFGHLQKSGRGLDAAVRSYNEAVGSAESRLMPSARRLRELGASSREIESVSPIDHQVRLPASAGDAGEGSETAA